MLMTYNSIRKIRGRLANTHVFLSLYLLSYSMALQPLNDLGLPITRVYVVKFSCILTGSTNMVYWSIASRAL